MWRIRSTLTALALLLVFSPLYAESDSPIHWYKAGMKPALEQAKKQNKPLFVYWGAVWCPPCNVVKTTIFKDPDFITATAAYINVYLDGDTDEAQKWGQTLKAKGYPTLMVLSPQGREVLRLSTSHSGSELAQTLNYARNVWNPLSDLLDEVLQAETIDPQKLQAIITYSWDQDDEVGQHARAFSAKLFALAQRLSADRFASARSQLFLQALSLQIDALSDGETLSSKQQKRNLTYLETILQNADLRRANLLTLAYQAQTLVEHLTDVKSSTGQNSRDDLIERFAQAMHQLREQPDLTTEQYFATFNPAIDFQQKFDTPLAQADKQQLIAYTVKQLKQTSDKKARAAMLSDATWLLFQFGLQQKARDITLAALDQSIAPYYLMSMMGYFEKELGNKDAALEWYKKAWQSAKGPATRLQWYGSYIRNLIKLKPEQTQAIKAHVGALFRDYATMPDSFLGRNLRVLIRVKKLTAQWAEQHLEEAWLESIKRNGAQSCIASDNELYRSGCEKFYAEFS